MKRILTYWVAVVLVLVSLFNVTACTVSVGAVNLMDNVAPRSVEHISDCSAYYAAYNDFALELLRGSRDGDDNVLLSPLSVLSALAMVANGMQGSTRAELESALGMSVNDLNLFLTSYVNSLPEGEKYKLSLANSIWLTDDERFTVNPDFLQLNADYYGADVYKTPLNASALRDINNWAKLKTDGMIKEVLDDISPYAVMYLVNALAFEAEWTKYYEDYQVRDGSFTSEDGERERVELMYSDEHVYLSDDLATGFMKYYKGGKYAFVALLPNEGVAVSEYLASLDGASLADLLASPEHRTVKTAIPKFEVEYDTELSRVLSAMGIRDAFDEDNADFTGLGTSTDGNIFIGRVVHKTFIELGERGTRAGAVTVIEMNDGSAGPPDEIKEVILDRPFVYMLIDCENNLPFFIGTLMDADD